MRRSVRLQLVLLLAASCGGEGAGPSEPVPDTMILAFRADGGRALLEVEVADEPAERARGLMGRTSLPDDRGMAFLFDAPTSTTFWMKDTLIPLSIAFWTEGDRIVAVLDMEPCESDPCPSYGPGVPFVGAVEVNQGWFERNGVEVGDSIELGARA